MCCSGEIWRGAMKGHCCERTAKANGRPIDQLLCNHRKVWSGRGDLNARPPAPKLERNPPYNPPAPRISTRWGVCFRSADISRGLNTDSIDTVLIRCVKPSTHSVQEVVGHRFRCSPSRPTNNNGPRGNASHRPLGVKSEFSQRKYTPPVLGKRSRKRIPSSTICFT